MIAPPSLSIVTYARQRSPTCSAIDDDVQIDNIKSAIRGSMISKIRTVLGIPSHMQMKASKKSERINSNMPGWCGMYTLTFTLGLRFPFPPFVSRVLAWLSIAPSQLMPNAWRTLLGIDRLIELHKVKISLKEFRSHYVFTEEKDKRVKLGVRKYKTHLVTMTTVNDRR